MEVEWARLKAYETRQLAEQDTIVILPIAAIEQHGPHLPVMVDSRLVAEVARLSAIESNEAGQSAVVLPTIWHGLSEHHMEFGGTVTLDMQTFYLVIRGVIESVARHGFSKFMILNGHGGNITASEIIVDCTDLENCRGPLNLNFLKTGFSAYRWRSLSHVTDNGVIGDPTSASREKGLQLFEAAAASLSELIISPETFEAQNNLRVEKLPNTYK